MRPNGRILTYMPLDFEMFGRISAEQLVSVDAKSKRSRVERKQLPSVHQPITPHCAPCAARDGSIIPFFPSPNQIQVPPTSHIAICEVDPQMRLRCGRNRALSNYYIEPSIRLLNLQCAKRFIIAAGSNF